MPKLARLTAAEVEALLLKSGFTWIRTKRSHRIYVRNGASTLHPKIVREALETIDDAGTGA